MKRIILIAVTGILFFAHSGGMAWAGENSPGFTVNGKQVEFSEDSGFPYISDTGSTMMPVRVCLDAIGCEVVWDGNSKTVLTRKGETEVDIPVGKNEIYINKKAVAINSAAVLKTDHTYLPLRAVLEAYGYTVVWDSSARRVAAVSPEGRELTPLNINGGTTGIFSRKQLGFEGFAGIQADVTLPRVTLAEKGDCPYVYFGFDWENDQGNAEGGFQFIEDPAHPGYNHWTVFLRQGSQWRWGDNIILEQGSTHHLKFYSETVSEERVDLVIELDGREVVRKPSAATDFSGVSVKAVVAMAMSKPFDGENCFSRSEGARISALQVLKNGSKNRSEPIKEYGSEQYADFENYELYSLWRPEVGLYGMHYGTVDCIPSYLHEEPDGTLSIYKGI